MDHSVNFPFNLDDKMGELTAYSRKDHVVKRLITDIKTFEEGIDFCCVKGVHRKHLYFLTREAFEKMNKDCAPGNNRPGLKARVQELELLIDVEKQRSCAEAEKVHGLQLELTRAKEEAFNVQRTLRKEIASLKEQAKQGSKRHEVTRKQRKMKSGKLKAFVCPISKEIMKDPQIMVSKKMTFDKPSIEGWFKVHNRCPLSGKRLSRDERTLLPNIALKSAIEEFASL
jgi:hypothetical protein